MKGTSGGLNARNTSSSWPKRRASGHLIAAEPCRSGEIFCAVMNLAGGDRDDIAGDSLHLAAVTIGSLRTRGYQADTELVMAVTRKAVVGDRLDSPDAGKRRALGTDFRLPGHGEC